MPETNNISTHYTEAELVDLLMNTSTDHTDAQFEQELTAHLQICEMKDHLTYLNLTHSNENVLSNILAGFFIVTTAPVKLISKLFKAGGALFKPENVKALVNGLVRLSETLGQMIDKGFASFKKRMTKESYVNERFDYLLAMQTRYQNESELECEAMEYDLQMGRFQGLVDICNEVLDMARASDTSAFANDRIFDQMASKSRGVMKTEEPMAGSAFRTFKWQRPFERTINFKESDWNNREKVEAMRKIVHHLRTGAIDTLQEAAKHIKKICEPYDKTEAEHVRFDNYEKMTKEFARGYAVTKFVTDMQSMILKEVNTFCSTGISKLTKFKGVK